MKMAADFSFICDSMLGRLGRWLRVLGYDTVFRREISDSDILLLLKSECQRILLTRDKRLHEKTIRIPLKSILITDDDIVKQLAYVGKALKLNLKVDPDNSRCSFCNTPLTRIIEPSGFRGLIPPSLRGTRRNFWYCSNCNKIFWKGRMWPNITRITVAASKMADS